MKKASVNFLLGLVIAVVWIFFSFVFVSNLYSSFSSKGDYSGQVEKFKGLLLSDVKSSYVVSIPDRGGKRIFLSKSLSCKFKGISFKEVYPDAPVVDGGVLYFCIYDSDSDRRFCDYVERNIVLAKQVDSENAVPGEIQKCILISSPGVYTFEFSPSEDFEGYVLTIDGLK